MHLWGCFIACPVFLFSHYSMKPLFHSLQQQRYFQAASEKMFWKLALMPLAPVKSIWIWTSQTRAKAQVLQTQVKNEKLSKHTCLWSQLGVQLANEVLANYGQVSSRICGGRLLVQTWTLHGVWPFYVIPTDKSSTCCWYLESRYFESAWCLYTIDQSQW